MGKMGLLHGSAWPAAGSPPRVDRLVIDGARSRNPLCLSLRTQLRMQHFPASLIELGAKAPAHRQSTQILPQGTLTHGLTPAI